MPKRKQDYRLVPFDPPFPHWFTSVVGSPNVLKSSATHMTVQGMQQQSHSTPSPHGHEMHGFVEPLMGFEMDETTEEDVDDGGMAGQIISGVCSSRWYNPRPCVRGSLTWKDDNSATT
jgi:hypothetical protein